MVIWIQLQALTNNSPQCGLLDTQPCTVSGLRGAKLKAFLTCFTLSSEGPDRPGRFAMHRHPSRWNFLYHYLFSSPGGHFRTWSENFAAQPQSTVFLSPQARKKPPPLTSPPFSLNLLPWRPTTKLSARGMYNKPGEFLFLYGSHVESYLPFKCTDFKKCVREL
jgi:hypothetical protein